MDAQRRSLARIARKITLTLAAGTAAIGFAMTRTSDAGGPDRSDTVLAEVRPILELTTEERDRLVTAYDAEVNRSIARCMREVGFERSTTSTTTTEVLPVRYGLSEADYAEQFGFGFSTTIDLDPLAVVPPDANESYRASLSSSERSRYDQALQRCWRTASEAITPPPGSQVSDAALALLEEIDARVQSSELVVRGNQGWRDCMAARGLQPSSRAAMFQEAGASAQPFLTIFDETRNALLGEGRRSDVANLRLASLLDADQRASLTDVQERERALATADIACGTEVASAETEARRQVVAELLGD